jgi:hypothetical protein
LLIWRFAPPRLTAWVFFPPPLLRRQHWRQPGHAQGPAHQHAGQATANRLDTLPPKLQRRFNLGIWYFDVPSAPERAAIWKIQAGRVGLEPKDLPDDTGWVGSDIRNCCQTA